MNNTELKRQAKRIRQAVLRTVAATGKGHIGGTFSCIDILVALYYGNVMRYDPRNPRWDQRDRLILGKGHACLALYNILTDLGFFDVSLLKEFGQNGSTLGGQLNIRTPGVEYNTGSLGHAIGVGAGMALAARLDGRKYRVYAIIGDGECAEGSIWESVMFAEQNHISNLIGVVDRNRLSVTDIIEDDEGTANLGEKFKAFGWDCMEIDGHDFESILSAFRQLEKQDKPMMIIANTIKGKGVSFMENDLKWHQSALTSREFEIAIGELEKE